MTLEKFLRTASRAADESVRVPKNVLDDIVSELKEGKRSAMLCVVLKTALAFRAGEAAVELIEREVEQTLEKSE